mmetsp:Transcript_29243/g.74153  ORF Transcript_29243/g.74153 Transcript_29243/m.74153 type:complete len:349 (-) Transcript_29243:63-1109(-)
MCRQSGCDEGATVAAAASNAAAAAAAPPHGGQSPAHALDDPGAPPLSVESSPDAGRYYVAARRVESGERLLEAGLEASVVDESYLTRVCAWCIGESKKGALRICCGDCQYVSYCSDDCQVAAAEAHGMECVALGRLKKLRTRLDREQSTQLRLALQVLYRRRYLQLRGEGAEDATEILCSGRGAFVEQKEWRVREKRYKAIVCALAGACGYDFHWTPDEVETVVGAIECNAFGIWDHNSSRCLGLSLSVNASLFNHSCAPNVARVRVGRQKMFYALSPVEQGEPLCISYIDPRKTLAERRDDLVHCYGFRCSCSRCTGPSQLPDMCHKHLGYFIMGDSQKKWCSACGA